MNEIIQGTWQNLTQRKITPLAYPWQWEMSFRSIYKWLSCEQSTFRINLRIYMLSMRETLDLQLYVESVYINSIAFDIYD